MRKNFITGLSLLLFGSLAMAQNFLKSDHIKVKETDSNGIVKFASFKNNSGISLNQAELLLKEALPMNAQNKLSIKKSERDVFGNQHLRYTQVFNGVEVAYSVYTIHAKNGQITSINGQFNPIELNTALNSLKNPAQIFQLGLANLGSSYNQIPEEFIGKTPKHKLVILAKRNSNVGADRYAYVFPIVSIENQTIEKVYLDALTGEVLKKEAGLFHHQTQETVMTEEQIAYLEKIKSNHLNGNTFADWTVDEGNADTRYSGSREISTKAVEGGFLLEDDARFLKTKNLSKDYLNVIFTIAFGGTAEDVEAMATDYLDNDNQWTAAEYNPGKNDAALEAHWGFANTYDFFKEEYDRDGFDDDNSNVTSFIHTTFFGNGNNAAWMSLSDIDEDAKGGFMFIGDGDYNPATGNGNYDALASMDVISHEYSHGVTNAASGLVYEKESGALNEGFADIWGATIEAKKAPEKQRWIMGEDFVQSNPAGIRSFESPKTFNQPNTYMGDFWQNASDSCTPGQDNDNCGVHTNSGVLNYWYYLISDGGNGTNDYGYSYEVDGMGIKKAADLVYSVQLNYVQFESKFADVRDYTIQEAAVLYGENSDEVITVKSAWCAVGVTSDESCDNLGVRDLSQQAFNVYPNPTNGILNIGSNKSLNDATYQITNTAGQTLLKGKVVNQKIDVNLLPKGVYVLTIKSTEGNQNVKFIKK